MHLSEGEIRAYLDQELSAGLRRNAETHLDSCSHCRAQAEALLTRAQRVNSRLSNLRSDHAQAQSSVKTARSRLTARLSSSEKENETMWSKYFSRVPRAAWITLAVVAILAFSLTFAPVRAIANSFLGLFRVEQIRIVQVNTDDLAHGHTSSSQLESMLSDNVQFEEVGEAQEVASAAEASALAGIPVRLPTAIEGEAQLEVQPGANMTFNVDLELIEAVLYDIGRSDIELPAELDGATVEMNIPIGVMAQFGECDFDLEAAHQEDYDPDDMPVSSIPDQPECTTLLQVASPTVSAPPGLNVAQIGEAYLQLLGMTPEDAAHFAQNVDWTTTFVIPIPRYGTEYYDVQVDGVTGSLIERGYGGYVVLWVKDGIVYGLNGPGDASDALEVANSLK